MKDYRILQGDVMARLADLPTASVHTCVTSPPYPFLRDYGLPPSEWPAVEYAPLAGLAPISVPAMTCCLGLEPDIDAFIGHMVLVFREVARVLRPDSTLWANMGDCYANAGQTGGDRRGTLDSGGKPAYTPIRALKPKDLLMVPARLALALQADGWYLRSAITWCKRAPMPESVTDRPTSATEMIFLFARSEKYYYDADAVREPHLNPAKVQAEIDRQHRRRLDTQGLKTGDGLVNHSAKWAGTKDDANAGRNLWNYWILGPEPYAQAHFATFPSEIPRRAILAGTSERGVCPECGAPWKRVTSTTRNMPSTAQYRRDARPDHPHASGHLMRPPSGMERETVTTGWQPTCKCGRTDTVPSVVLDPFSGAGTTALVALRLGRRAIGVELNPDYVTMSHKRILGDPQAMNLNMELVEMEETA